MKNFSICFLVFPFWIPLQTFGSSESIFLTIGESKLIHVESAKKVAIGNPEIADVTAVSDQEILLSAKSAGNTNLIFISPDGEKETKVITVSAHNLKKSMVEVGVEVMEIDTQSALKAGLSWGSVSTSTSGTSGGQVTPNNLTIGEDNPPPLVAFGSFTRQSLTASIQLLIDRGKAKILSKPKLLAVSGSEASFLSGGEIPYVSESNLGSTNVQWKPYGVKLKIKPTIDGEDNISADLRIEVSGIDNANGVSTGNGIIIPALSTRWAETSVYMKSGSTLVIAGLINENDQKLTSGIPLLSDIPILGELFRFTNDQKNQTELVIFVTPSLVGESDTES
jgi:pilus assembly protein CpaC